MGFQKLVLGSIRRRFVNKLDTDDAIFFLAKYCEKKYLLIEGGAL
jgi:hypothetical protein